LWDSFVGPHVTQDTHVGLVAHGWLDSLVFSWVFNLACSSTAEAQQRDVGGSLAAVLLRRHTARRWQRSGSSTVAAAVAAARHRDVGGSLATARQAIMEKTTMLSFERFSGLVW